MSLLRAAAALLATTSYALGVPTPLAKRSSFRVDQVEGGMAFKAGPLAMMRAYSKYGVPVPANIRAAAELASTGSVTANPLSYDRAYLCRVTVGQTEMDLDFDTGSADLWVFSDLTPSNEMTGQTRYETSSGTQMRDYTWSIGYGDGSGASGVVFADQVTVGDVTATQQAVEAATSVSSQFSQDAKTDGLLGLAFSNINTVAPRQQNTFFETVRDSLALPLFAADLKTDEPGSFDFGYIDQSKYVGEIFYTDVDPSQGFWTFEAGDGIGASIMDTGTTLLLLPDDVVQQYYRHIDSAVYDASQAGYVFSCDENLPAMELEIDGNPFVVPGKLLNYSPVDPQGSKCFGGLQSSTGLGINIFGDVFIRSFYVIFDQTQSTPRLGIAKQA